MQAVLETDAARVFNDRILTGLASTTRRGWP